jgi:hypothetical protein
MGEKVRDLPKAALQLDESFQGYARSRLKRYVYTSRNQFFLYQRDAELSFSHWYDDLPLLIRQILKIAKPASGLALSNAHCTKLLPTNICHLRTNCCVGNALAGKLFFIFTDFWMR